MDFSAFFLEPTLAKVVFGSFAVGLSGAVAPGPLLVRVIQRAPRFGVWTGPITIVGHALLELSLLIGLLYGLGAYLERPAVSSAIAFLGGLVLAVFSIAMFRSLPTLELVSPEEPLLASPSAMRLIGDGILTTSANPYWWLWWATVGLGYMTLSAPLGKAGIIAFFLGHIASDFAWYTLVSGTLASGKGFLSNRIYRGLVGSCAAAMAVFAVWFTVSAFERTG